MNNGNYENLMIKTTTISNSPKKILKWDDTILDGNLEDYGLDKDSVFPFLHYLNDVNTLSDALSSLSVGKWKFLFAILRKLSGKDNSNYCFYENPEGLLFDITTHSVEYKEATILRGNKVETEAEQLQKLKEERIMLECKIKDLQEKHTLVCERLKELVQSFIGEAV